MVGKKILLVPLNWGLGHASRIIPLISVLKSAGISIVIGGSPSHISFIQNEFNDLDTLVIPHLHIKLNGKKRQGLRILLQIPMFLLNIFNEHRALKKIISKYKIDTVISDNCYGLWNHEIHSIFITHQIRIKLPPAIKFLENPINKINRNLLGKYDECWVPDIEEDGGLAGELSHPETVFPKLKFIGIMSRFNSFKLSYNPDQNEHTGKLLIIISGPENQRTIFENIIKNELKNLGEWAIWTVIRGLPLATENNLPSGWFNHLPTHELGNLIMQSDYIICRSGYSSIMDLSTLGRTALLIPTPGQTEQEYLAGFLSKKGLFAMQKQEDFNLREGIRTLEKFKNEYEMRIKSSFRIHQLRTDKIFGKF
jgi:predicted glycosyltransferase